MKDNVVNLADYRKSTIDAPHHDINKDIMIRDMFNFIIEQLHVSGVDILDDGIQREMAQIFILLKTILYRTEK